MNIIDVLLILFILLFGVIGWKNGFFRSIVSVAGLILVFSLSFMLKNPIAEWLSLNLPFFDFWGDFNGVTILNVVIYQLIAFFIVFSILMVIYAFVVKLSGFLEKILKATIILGIPSKILGFIVGIIEGQVIASILLVFLSLPVFNLSIVHESKIKAFMLESTPLIGNLVSDTSQALAEIMTLKDTFSSDSSKDEFNRQSLDIMLEYGIVKVDYADKLISSGKLKITNSDQILNKYR